MKKRDRKSTSVGHTVWGKVASEGLTEEMTLGKMPHG